MNMVKTNEQRYLQCPACGNPFHWDGIASGDTCPSPGCKTFVCASTNEITLEQYNAQWEIKLFEMQHGGKYLISVYDYIHRNCGGVVVFNMQDGSWKCPKCHLKAVPGLDGLLEKRKRIEDHPEEGDAEAEAAGAYAEYEAACRYEDENDAHQDVEQAHYENQGGEEYYEGP